MFRRIQYADLRTWLRLEFKLSLAEHEIQAMEDKLTHLYREIYHDDPPYLDSVVNGELTWSVAMNRKCPDHRAMVWASIYQLVLDGDINLPIEAVNYFKFYGQPRLVLQHFKVNTNKTP